MNNKQKKIIRDTLASLRIEKQDLQAQKQELKDTYDEQIANINRIS